MPSSSNDLVVKSRGGLFPHTHTLVVPGSALADPGQGDLLLDTSTEYSLIFKHKHQVLVTKDNFAQIRAGQEVVVHDTDKGRHTFAIRKG